MNLISRVSRDLNCVGDVMVGVPVGEPNKVLNRRTERDVVEIEAYV